MNKEDAKIDTMDEASDTYVASNLYEDEDLEINVGESPTREMLASSPPRVDKMEVDVSARHLKSIMAAKYNDILELLMQRGSPPGMLVGQ